MREYIRCAQCGTKLIKHPDEKATDPKFCAECWRKTPADQVGNRLPK
jgi:DNA-directed RNA polymerase subunit RPC12/RpoP